MRLLLIDNYDSFTHILAHGLISEGFSVTVKRPRDVQPKNILDQGYQALCISPGPGKPSEAPESIAAFMKVKDHIPVLGICLGMQIMAEQSGGLVEPTGAPVHGHPQKIEHTQRALFTNIPNPTTVARYHSLAVRSFGSEYHMDAWTRDQLPMAIRHTSLPIYGVQFHPESFLSTDGQGLLANFADICRYCYTGDSV